MDIKNKLYYGVIALVVIASFFQIPAEVKKTYSSEERQLILDIYQTGTFRFETETSATETSNTPRCQIDFRHIGSYPHLLKRIIRMLKDRASHLSFDALCGVPYDAIPMAANLAYKMRSPLLTARCSVDTEHPSRKIYGVLRPSLLCLVIQDVTVTGKSMLETIESIEQEGLRVEECLILFDREEGGVQKIQKTGKKVHVLFTITDFVNVLLEENKISESKAQEILHCTKIYQK